MSSRRVRGADAASSFAPWPASVRLAFSTLAGVLALGGCAPAPAAKEPPAPLVSAGEHIAQRNCAECHALGEQGASPYPDAPPFRELRARIPREAMAHVIQQRMDDIHPRMPKLELDVDEVGEFLDYWEGLKPAPKAPLRSTP